MNASMPRFVQAVFALIGIVLLFHILIVGANILIPLAFSFIFALLLYPLVKRMENIKIPRGLAIIAAMLGLLILLGVVLFFIINEFSYFSDELPIIEKRLEDSFASLQVFIENNFGITSENQIDWLQEKVSGLLEGSGGFISGFIATTSGVLTQAGLVPIYIFFMLFYRDIFVEFFFKVAPLSQQSQTAAMMTQIQQVIQNYLVGLFTVIIIIAVLNTTSLLVIGVDHALFFGVFAALLTVVPYIGVFIGSMIPVLYSLAMTGDIVQPLLVFGAFTVVQWLEGNFITPQITGSKVSINPLAAIVALFVGGAVWGIAGMIMFVPFVAMVKVVCDHIEPLKPYGILLGARRPDKETKNRWHQLTDRFLRMGKQVTNMIPDTEKEEGSDKAEQP